MRWSGSFLGAALLLLGFSGHGLGMGSGPHPNLYIPNIPPHASAPNAQPYVDPNLFSDQAAMWLLLAAIFAASLIWTTTARKKA